MKKIAANGAKVKTLRLQLERFSTQKELANKILVGERTLRNVENNNAALPVPNFTRLAEALGVNVQEIMLSPTGYDSKTNARQDNGSKPNIFDQDILVPRFDKEYARATSDEAILFQEAKSSSDIKCVIEVSLGKEIGGYIQELVEILVGLSWERRNILVEIAPTQEVETKRQIKRLLVLLKGNDVWVYQTSIIRRLPERDTLQAKGEACTFEHRLVVGFGPPAEYGDDSMLVTVDNGQPWLLPAKLPVFGIAKVDENSKETANS